MQAEPLLRALGSQGSRPGCRCRWSSHPPQHRWSCRERPQHQATLKRTRTCKLGKRRHRSSGSSIDRWPCRGPQDLPRARRHGPRHARKPAGGLEARCRPHCIAPRQVDVATDQDARVACRFLPGMQLHSGTAPLAPASAPLHHPVPPSAQLGPRIPVMRRIPRRACTHGQPRPCRFPQSACFIFMSRHVHLSC